MMHGGPDNKRLLSAEFIRDDCAAYRGLYTGPLQAAGPLPDLGFARLFT
jgi:hypothetical protein